MKGLQDAIGLTVVHPTWQRTKPNKEDDQHVGWAFAAPDQSLKNPTGHGNYAFSDTTLDPNNESARFIRDLYELANDTSGKYSVPVLWDKQNKTIVNNESSEIIQMFNAEFNDFAKHPEVDLAPKALLNAMSEVDGWTYEGINNGVYKCGFAQT